MGRGKGGGEEGREREKVRGEDVVWRGRRGQRGAGDVRERWKKKYRGIEREKDTISILGRREIEERREKMRKAQER